MLVQQEIPLSHRQIPPALDWSTRMSAVGLCLELQSESLSSCGASRVSLELADWIHEPNAESLVGLAYRAANGLESLHTSC